MGDLQFHNVRLPADRLTARDAVGSAWFTRQGFKLQIGDSRVGINTNSPLMSKARVKFRQKYAECYGSSYKSRTEISGGFLPILQPRISWVQIQPLLKVLFCFLESVQVV
jgi:hypothetical protein